MSQMRLVAAGFYRKYNVQIVRRCGTTVREVPHLPPFLIRVGIISSSVGLATPLFATVGVARLWYNYLPKTANGQILKLVLGIAGGGGGISLTFNYVYPFLRDHSNFVLPFALSNAFAAGFWYTVGEVTLGLPFMTGVMSIESLGIALPGTLASFLVRSLATAGLPFGGVLVGGLTALTDNDPFWLLNFYEFIALPVGIPTGILSGTLMHIMLKPSIAGTPGVHWNKRSLPVLIALMGSSACYFYLSSSPSSDYLWEPRMNILTGDPVSYNPVTKVTMNGLTKASIAQKQQAFAKILHYSHWFKGVLKDEITQVSKEIGIADRRVFYKVVDVLVRFQYLSNEVRKRKLEGLDYSSPVYDIEVLKTEALLTIGVSDVDGLFETVELAVIAQRRNNLVKNKNSVLLVKEMKNRILTYSSRKSDEGVTAPEELLLLSNRLTEFEDEIFLKLKYKVADSVEKEQLLLEGHELKHKRRQLMNTIKYTTAIAASFGLLYFLPFMR